MPSTPDSLFAIMHNKEHVNALVDICWETAILRGAVPTATDSNGGITSNGFSK
jgi:hypothetical protein